MPIDFPNSPSPSHGDTFVNGTTVWEYSSAVPGWNIDRTAIVEIGDGLVSGANFANDSITSDNLESESYPYILGTNTTTTVGNYTTLLTSASMPAGQYLVFANINSKLINDSIPSYAINFGATQIAGTFLQIDSDTIDPIWHTFTLSVLYEASTSNTFNLQQACWRESVEAQATHTRLAIVKIGGA